MIVEIDAIPALVDNYIYALSDANGACVIIDPGDAAPVREYILRNNLRLAVIVCTHHHADHVAGACELAEEFHAAIWTSTLDLPRIRGSTKAIHEGEYLTLLGDDLRIIEVPGHTLGHIALYFPRLSAVFVGDTLFSLGCGRLFEGTAKQMYTSIQKLKNLPMGTKIYFGHEYTLQNLKFLRTQGVQNTQLDVYEKECQSKCDLGKPTTPTILRLELALNPFLQIEDADQFADWRGRRDHF